VFEDAHVSTIPEPKPPKEEGWSGLTIATVQEDSMFMHEKWASSPDQGCCSSHSSSSNDNEDIADGTERIDNLSEEGWEKRKSDVLCSRTKCACN